MLRAAASGICSDARQDGVAATPADQVVRLGRLAADAGSNFQRVNVETKNATVTLTGVVELWAERNRAETLAYRAPGVQRVVNNLQVESPQPPR